MTMEVHDHLVVWKPVLWLRRLGHVNLFVSSLEKARDFYSQTCGFIEIFEEPAIIVFPERFGRHAGDAPANEKKPS